MLVVHDDERVRQGLTGILTRRGYSALSAADIDEATATVTRCDPALLIIRSELPSGPYRSLLDSIDEPLPAIILDARGTARPRAISDPRVVAILDPPWPLADLYRTLERAHPRP